MQLTLEAIRMIDTIAKVNSYEQASEILQSPTTTLIEEISEIEKKLGLVFFEKREDQIILTPTGQLLLEEGRILLGAVTDLEARLQKMAGGVELELNIVFDELFPLEEIMPLFTRFKNSLVATELNISREVMMGAWEALLKFRADIIVALGEGPSGGGYSTYPIGVVPFIFAVAPTHPLAAKEGALTKHDLLKYPAIMLSDSARSLPRRQRTPHEWEKVITVNTLQDKIALQIAGVGHGFLPKKQAQAYLDAGTLVTKEVVEGYREETLYLAWRTHDEGLALNWWKEALAEKWLS